MEDTSRDLYEYELWAKDERVIRENNTVLAFWRHVTGRQLTIDEATKLNDEQRDRSAGSYHGRWV